MSTTSTSPTTATPGNLPPSSSQYSSDLQQVLSRSIAIASLPLTQLNSTLTDFAGNYRINTKNHLLGLQVGGDCYDVHEGWYWGIKGDVGLYCNFVNGFANVQGTDPSASATPLSVVSNASAQTAAFFGEQRMRFRRAWRAGAGPADGERVEHQSLGRLHRACGQLR